MRGAGVEPAHFLEMGAQGERDGVRVDGLAQIEQPLAWDDLVQHAALQRQLKTPLCLDESITSVERAHDMVALGSGVPMESRTAPYSWSVLSTPAVMVWSPYTMTDAGGPRSGGAFSGQRVTHFTSCR